MCAVPIGPPKGIEVRDFHRFLSIFIDFRRFFLKKNVLYMKIEPGWWRNCPGYIWESFRSWEWSQKLHFESQNLIFRYLGIFNLQF